MHIRRSAEEIAANRARYEEHQKKGLEFAPTALPGKSPLPAPVADAASIIHREIIPGGWYWSTRVKPFETLRISLDAGFSSLAMVAWKASEPSERLNLPDTVKLQWTTGLGKGRVIFSDMGRVMFSITEDSSAAHDCLMGGSNTQSNAAKYPDAITRNTRDNLILLATKLGLDRRDIPAALSLFAPVRVDSEGRFEWRPELMNDGDYIDLRAEMEMTVGFSNCPHPLDPNPVCAPKPVTVTRLAAVVPEAGDLCRTATAEAVRGFENNAFATA
ncbi:MULTISPECIES: urea amidolyase associated protein UAAP1 [Alphaproteobacteria]|uniref:Urea carboxylase n=2 Tax=Alphaproteobacteria TaxID=28211 RepID=A0A512HMG4_9HYPH|nr:MULTISPECIES: urea amidolyase associated protein UAAP1 [Alphaproteobacteria]GEO86629.1 urea carboxylase [Ciceribacter naphthalenivorans]GLR23641.1 urea carboxylase [Ciceribacter naphthalenivorans]GLT06497.1 urea carboxylase [Sphingomonas psychrolutea]